MTGDLIIFAAIVLVAAVAGIGLGMLVAPRIGRLIEPGDGPPPIEETGDDRQP
jgi:hypothetical protein